MSQQERISGGRLQEWKRGQLCIGGMRSVCPHAVFLCFSVCACVSILLSTCLYLATAFLFSKNTAVCVRCSCSGMHPGRQGYPSNPPIQLVGKEGPTALQTAPQKLWLDCSPLLIVLTTFQEVAVIGYGGIKAEYYSSETGSLWVSLVPVRKPTLKPVWNWFQIGLWKAAPCIPCAKLCCFKTHLEQPC